LSAASGGGACNILRLFKLIREGDEQPVNANGGAALIRRVLAWNIKRVASRGIASRAGISRETGAAIMCEWISNAGSPRPTAVQTQGQRIELDQIEDDLMLVFIRDIAACWSMREIRFGSMD
jgi:hypothetical protein